MSQVALAGSPLLAASPPRDLSREPASARDWSPQVTLSAMGALFLFAAAALCAWLVSGLVVPWDSKNQFYPFFRFMADGLSRGDLPTWNPYQYGGHPSVADPQSLFFTPTMVIFGLIAPKASMFLFDAVVFAHLFAGGLGMIGLFRRRRWHPAGAVLAAIIFMLGGVAASRLQHTGIILSYSFFPLALLALEETLARRSWIAAVAFGVATALMLLGRDQAALLLAFALFAAFLFQLARETRRFDFLRAALPRLALATLIILCMLAVPSLLTMQFLAGSNRPGIAYGIAAAGSMHPANFATFIAGNIFGSTNWTYDYWGPGYEATDFADYTDRTINYLFTGTLTALLIFWHGLAGGRLLGRSIRFFLLLGIAACIYALGRYTPVFGLLFDHMPGVALYRRPADAAFLINIAVAAGAGYLLHRYVQEGLPQPFRRLPKPLAFLLTASTIILLGATIASALGFAHRKDQLAASLGALTGAVLLTVIMAAVLIFAARGGAKWRAIAASLLVLATAGELIARNAASSLNSEPADRYAVHDGLAPDDRKGLELLATEMAAAHARGHFPRVEILGLEGPWQNASMVLRLENTLGYNPLRTADYARAIGPAENAGDPNLRHFPGTFRGYRCSLASLLGLEYLVLDRPLDQLPRHFPRPRATPVYEGRKMFIYKLADAAPRAFLAQDVQPIDRDSVLAESTFPDFDRSRTALIDEDATSALQLTYPIKNASGKVTIVEQGNSHVALDVDSTSGGLLVLHDLHYPGWRVRVDGADRPLLRTNLLFRGVEVGPGRHRVTFEFRPFAASNLLAAARLVLSRDAD